jgi:DNA integrity scanning protein DisA with diadenylate cyclase activity
MGADDFQDVCRALRERYSPTVAYLLCLDPEVIRQTRDTLGDIPLIVPVNQNGAGNELLAAGLKKLGVKAHGIHEDFELDLGILPQARVLLLAAHSSRLFGVDDRVLFLVHTNIQSWGFFEGRNLRRNRLGEMLQGRLRTEVLESVLDLAVELVREGREGFPVGALFMVGDAEKVMEQSREGIANPFEGHPSRTRNIADRRNWKTIKNFAALDGACVLDAEGGVVAAGRYINVGDQWASFLKGVGGRHSAAMVASRGTRTVAVCASQEGTISVFIDGEPVYSVHVRG